MRIRGARPKPLSLRPAGGGWVCGERAASAGVGTGKLLAGVERGVLGTVIGGALLLGRCCLLCPSCQRRTLCERSERELRPL
eukprot:364507-Chlamydomonas_euryale.AAC.12